MLRQRLDVVGGCAERELEVLEDVTEADIENTKKTGTAGILYLYFKRRT